MHEKEETGLQRDADRQIDRPNVCPERWRWGSGLWVFKSGFFFSFACQAPICSFKRSKEIVSRRNGVLCQAPNGQTPGRQMMMETGVVVLTGHSNCDVRPAKRCRTAQFREPSQCKQETIETFIRNQEVNNIIKPNLQETGTLPDSANKIRFRSKSSGNYENQSERQVAS